MQSRKEGKAATTGRRRFLQVSGIALLAGIISLWDRIIDHEEKAARSGFPLRVKPHVNSGVEFFEKCYVIFTPAGARAFSNTCTHAGCRLKQEVNGLITCPCHGSQFEASTGQPVRGPAFRPLTPLKCTADPKTGYWLIHA